MLTKSQTLTAIQKSLIKYNELVANQITTKINAHNTVATTAAQGHMSAAMVIKLNGIQDGAEVNQNAISKIQIGSDVVTASGKESTATFKGENGVSVAFDDANAISITGVNASTTAKGVVQLTDGVTSTSTSTAATAKAAKTSVKVKDLKKKSKKHFLLHILNINTYKLFFQLSWLLFF